MIRNLAEEQRLMRERWAPRHAKIRKIHGSRFRRGFMRLLRECGFTKSEAETWLLKATFGPLLTDILADQGTVRLLRGELLGVEGKLSANAVRESDRACG